MKEWKNYSHNELLGFEVISTALRSKPQLLELIFDPLVPRVNFTRETFPEVLSRLSHRENILARVALDLWNSTGNVMLWEIVEVLGRKDQLNLIDALVLKELGQAESSRTFERRNILLKHSTGDRYGRRS
jgi:hypothetical protein